MKHIINTSLKWFVYGITFMLWIVLVVYASNIALNELWNKTEWDNLTLSMWNSLVANVQDIKTQVDTKANTASPNFTGTPTAPNPPIWDNTTKIATTSWVNAATASAASGSFGTCYYELQQNNTLSCMAEYQTILQVNYSAANTVTVGWIWWTIAWWWFLSRSWYNPNDGVVWSIKRWWTAADNTAKFWDNAGRLAIYYNGSPISWILCSSYTGISSNLNECNTTNQGLNASIVLCCK